jgi:signal peptidase
MTAKSWNRMATWAIRLVLFAVLGGVAFAVAVLVVIPRATHGVALNVLTGSMTPGIPVGSVVIDRPVDPGTLKVGDVATYQKAPGKPEFITHRVVKIDASKNPVLFTFKGDANRGEDVKPVPATAIRGKVWFHVPYLGALRDTLHTGGGMAAVAMLVLVGYALVQVGGALRDRRPKADEPTAAAAALIPRGAAQARPDAPSTPILVVMRSEVREGLTAGVFASLWSAVLLDEDDLAGTFTLLLAETSERAAATVELLRSFDPLRLDLHDRSAELAAPDTEHAHA